MKMSRRVAWTLGILATLLLFIVVNNHALFAPASASQPFLLAHRGLGQTFGMEGITGDTCTAARIFPPEHPYLENSIPGIDAAFAAGAQVVEIDIRPTRDGHFIVFHDWTLDCRTDLTGLPSDYTLAELKTADIGYGYTADGGQTYPLRGQGVGLMPALAEVLERYAQHELLLHIKSNDPAEGRQLAQMVAELPMERQARIAVYGGDAAIEALTAELPSLRVMSRATLQACLLPYLAIGWTGYVPAACHGTQLHLPETIAPWLWGWPTRFVARMERADTRVILVAGDGGWSEGFDHPQDLQRIPTGYGGGIWTNRIDRIGPIYSAPPS